MPWRPRVSTPTGTSPATAPPTRCSRGITSPPGCTATSSGRTGSRPSPSTGSPIVGGRRATTAGCAPGTRSSTSWLPTSRPRGGAREPVRISRWATPSRCSCSRPPPGAAATVARSPLRGDAGVPVRVRFSKHGPVRFISHRDVARSFERAFRIAELPLAFSSGFSPHPKVSFGPALAVGYESDAEYLDLELVREVDLGWLLPAISDGLPEGMDVTGIAPLADRAPSLQESIEVLGYRVECTGADPATLGRSIADFMALECLEVPVHRKGE